MSENRTEGARDWDKATNKGAYICPDIKTSVTDTMPVKHECGTFEAIKGIKQRQCVPKSLCHQRNLGLTINCESIKAHSTYVERLIAKGAQAMFVSSSAAMIAIYQMV